MLIAILAGYILKDGIIGWGLFWLYIAFFWFGTALYLIPTYVCILRKVEQKAGIILLNIFLGWSILGWVGALIWASIAPAIKNKKNEKVGSALLNTDQTSQMPIRVTRKPRTIVKRKQGGMNVDGGSQHSE